MKADIIVNKFSNDTVFYFVILFLWIVQFVPFIYLTSIILFYTAKFWQKPFVRLDSKQNKFSG